MQLDRSLAYIIIPLQFGEAAVVYFENPFPILRPCHRVIRSDATLGQFGGGTELKRNLIGLETGVKSLGV